MSAKPTKKASLQQAGEGENVFGVPRRVDRIWVKSDKVHGFVKATMHDQFSPLVTINVDPAD